MKRVYHLLVHLSQEALGGTRFLNFCCALLVVVDRDDKHVLIALHERRDVLSADGRYEEVPLMDLHLVKYRLSITRCGTAIRLGYEASSVGFLDS